MTEHEVMTAPLTDEDFEKMTKKQAQEYLDWYISHIDEWIENLKNLIAEDKKEVVLDYSVESLIPLWSWYEEKIEVCAIPNVPNDGRRQYRIADKTLRIGSDVAVYFAEVVRRNNVDKVEWGFFNKPKNSFFVNQPLLMGFDYGQLEPKQIVYTDTLKSCEERNEKILWNAYHKWIKDLLK